MKTTRPCGLGETWLRTAASRDGRAHYQAYDNPFIRAR